MATLALSLAGQALGGMVAGPLGAMAGRALGALGGSMIDNRLFGETPDQPARDVRLQGSSEGIGVPRIYGWNRLSGNIIWATELEELASEDAGAKGLGGASSGNEVAASFALALCEGEVHRLGRIWADGQLLDTEGLTLRFHRGTETQNADSLIEAKQGPEAPAYRGVAYMVFERLLLGRFGNRIPTITAEVCRVVGDLEPRITAITVIPGATEFGYDPEPRVRIVGPGETIGENTHLSRHRSDWTLSIDELVALCPRLEHVGLVVSWFGDDLRCQSCTVGPRVEAQGRVIDGVEWQVAGLGRSEVPVVSQHEGGPAYGGTPSDHAVLAAIADLKARGLKVMLYPLIMMDIPANNALADPYTGNTDQPAYPWRGRITCDPAPGVAGTPAGNAAVDGQVAQFVAAGYRQMHLHYAQLAADAGGIDAMLIGSEMRGMTTLRGAGTDFPFVDALVALAGQVRAIVGPTTNITYAADWSEYSGVQAGNEKLFHLDPLWGSDAIDAVGIDNYMPTADWRDGLEHADAGVFASHYDAGYLAANILGGEGYDWFYASETDRRDGVRTPITDGAHDEAWVWRFKDLKSWWSQAHHDRPAGVRNAAETAWVPGSKPIWFTELGCGAVDKGANQPNVFGDEKSAEDGRPYFSSGVPDSLMQRQFLRAHAGFWRNPANNPPGMVDTDRIYLWTWDARAYPAFPARDDVWADSVNHPTGHWLTGRLGGMASDELAGAILTEHGAEAIDLDPLPPFILGAQLAGPTTAREALGPLLELTGLDIVGRQDGVAVVGPDRSAKQMVAEARLVDADGPVLTRRRSDSGERHNRLALSYLDRERDYLAGTATATSGDAGALRLEAIDLVLDAGGGRAAAETMLMRERAGREQLSFALAPAQLAFEPGDVVAFDGAPDATFVIEDIEDGTERRMTARALAPPGRVATASGRQARAAWAEYAAALPEFAAVILPGTPDDPLRARAALAAYAKPWPGPMSVTLAEDGNALTQLPRRAHLGETLSALSSGQASVWDERSLNLKLFAGHLSDGGDAAALAGTRRVALETDRGWEVLGFARCELVETGEYRISRLLRGMAGTGHAIGAIAAGARVVVLDDAVTLVDVPQGWLGGDIEIELFAGPDDLTGRPHVLPVPLDVVLPLAPAHLRTRRASNGDLLVEWVRRSRADAGNWQVEPPLEHAPERYEISIWLDGTAVRRWQVVQPETVYAEAEQIADFGTSGTPYTLGVAQVSAVFGPGHITRKDIG